MMSSYPSFYLPPEWTSQSGVMLTWPHIDTIWADTLSAIDEVFTEVAAHISKRERVLIASSNITRIDTILKNSTANRDRISIFEVASDDIWVRDHGPISVIAENKPLLLDFIFNGWGNKYPAKNDNCLTKHLHRLGGFHQTPHLPIDMVIEGGALEVDGKGSLLTTKSCLLASNRNPHLTQEEIENKLQTYLGIHKILWLEHGYLEGDDTDGHIDTLARFTNADTICYVSCDDRYDPHFSSLKEMEKELQTFASYQGKPYQLVPLPWPKARFADYDGRRLPLNYANFLMINEAILVPTYDDPADQIAISQLQRCFKNREIIPINCLPVIQWYGSLHCMTMQLPEGIL